MLGCPMGCRLEKLLPSFMFVVPGPETRAQRFGVVDLSGCKAEILPFRRNPMLQEKSYASGEILPFRRNAMFQEKSYLSGEILCFKRNPTLQEKCYLSREILCFRRNPTNSREILRIHGNPKSSQKSYEFTEILNNQDCARILARIVTRMARTR